MGEVLRTDEQELAAVRNFFDGDRLVTIPARRSRRVLVLRYLAEQFRPGQRYPERDVNWILGRHHRDFALLRRLLVDEELLQRDRDGGSYWRAGSIPGVEWP
ncbi:MAG TPA: DUF2087 domain-containing protein [Candidatus Dormibacteraeota bacterium]